MKEVNFSNFEDELNDLIPKSIAELTDSVIDDYNVADMIRVLIAGMKHAHNALGNFKLYERVNDIYGIGGSNCTIANMHANMAADSMLFVANNNDFSTDAFPENTGVLIGVKVGEYNLSHSLWLFVGSMIHIRSDVTEWNVIAGGYRNRTLDVSGISGLDSAVISYEQHGHVIDCTLTCVAATTASEQTYNLGAILPAPRFETKINGGRINAYEYSTNAMMINTNGTVYIGGNFIADTRYTFSGSYIIEI